VVRAGLVRKKTATLCFVMPFPSDTRSFVKTGSGQTYEKDLKSKRDDVIFGAGTAAGSVHHTDQPVRKRSF
jgi:hypothetical protein